MVGRLCIFGVGRTGFYVPKVGFRNFFKVQLAVHVKRLMTWPHQLVVYGLWTKCLIFALKTNMKQWVKN